MNKPVKSFILSVIPILFSCFRMHTQRARCLYLLNSVQILHVAGTLVPATSKLSVISFPIVAFNANCSKSESSYPGSGIIRFIKSIANQIYFKIVNQIFLIKTQLILLKKFNSFIKCSTAIRKAHQPFMNDKSHQDKAIYNCFKFGEEINTHIENENAIKNNQEHGDRKNKQIYVNQNILVGITCSNQSLNKNLHVKISKNALAA